MISDDLLDIARRLAEGNPTQADLRRAVSSVYYAVFHAICQSNADTLVGDNPQDRMSRPGVRLIALWNMVLPAVAVIKSCVAAGFRRPFNAWPVLLL